MNPNDLIGNRRGDWERLTELLKHAQRRGIRSLSEAQILELGDLYRAATADLALVQRDFPNHALASYLNRLVGQAHALVYQDEPVTFRRLREFYLRGFPRVYRELAPFTLTAILLFFGTALIGYLVTLANRDAPSYVLSPSLIADIRDGRQWWTELNGLSSVGASIIMTNNLQVSFLAFAGGILFGFLTLYILIMNGLYLGMVLGLAQSYGHAAPLWEFVIGHGVLELSEITFAGGCGLALGSSLLQPGLLSRRDALTTMARKAVQMLLGSLPLLLIAGTIEAFVSPSAAPAALKYAIGIGSGVLLYVYLLLGGRPSGNALPGRSRKSFFISTSPPHLTDRLKKSVQHIPVPRVSRAVNRNHDKTTLACKNPLCLAHHGFCRPNFRNRERGRLAFDRYRPFPGNFPHSASGLKLPPKSLTHLLVQLISVRVHRAHLEEHNSSSVP